jgi:recombination protein RecA
MRRRRPGLTKQIEELANKKPQRTAVDISTLIPSGSTMLNLACSDNPYGAFALGRIVTLPGGSASGKTMLMLTMLAECANDKRFNDYELIYDDGEETCDGFDIKYLFGKRLVERILPPTYAEDKQAIHSETIQDFKANILMRVKMRYPFIYILDSLDSLTTDEELKKEYKQALIKAKSPDAVKELKGSYKTEKAKAIGETLRMINNQLKHTKSALFIVQQERANIGIVFGPTKTTSGGMAPFFYSTHQVWLNKKSSITKEVKSLKRKTGNLISAKVTKNKITGKLRDIEFETYYDYGVDDLSSCIDFLVSAEHWKKVKQVINAADIDLSGTKNTLIEKIEDRKLQNEIQTICGIVWLEIEDSIRLKRQRKFE